MKRAMYISIPQPCHENWEAMTPQDKDRFCAQCAKTVIDFSALSDTQILNYLHQSTGRLCGRFAQEQVERPLVPFKKEKKKIWWMAALMPLTLLMNKVNGQKNPGEEKTSIAKETIVIVNTTCTKRRPVAKETIQVLTHTIHGNVKDEKGNALPFTTVSVSGNHAQTMTDEKGDFTLQTIHPQHDDKLLISNVSYEQQEVAIDLNNTMNIVLKEKAAVLPEVCVKTIDSYLSGRLGGFILVAPITRKDSVKTTLRKIFHTNPFKVYPNPVTRGTAINIEVKKEGIYSIQLLNAHSKLITHRLFNAVNGATLTSLAIPSSAAAGVYFIRLVNDDTKQQFTDKIVVQ